MPNLEQFVPLRLVLPGWPTNIIAIPPMIDSIGLPLIEVHSSGIDNLSASGTIQILEEIETDLPLIPGLSFAILNNGDFTEFDFHFDYFEDWFEIGLDNLSASLRLSNKLFKRMVLDDMGLFIEAAPDPLTGLPLPIELSLDGAHITFNVEGEFEFDFAGSTPVLSITPFSIGDTGIIIDSGPILLSLSATAAAQLASNPDYQDAQLTENFRGVFIPNGTIYFPESFPLESAAIQNGFIGNHGFTGSVAIDAQNPQEPVDDRGALANFPFVLNTAAIEFVQNSITFAQITGTLTIPYFDQPAAVTLGIGLDGRYTITLASEDGVVIDLPNLGSLTLTGLGLDIDGDDVALILSGSLQLTAGAPALDWPLISVREWRIDPNGQIQIPSGWIDLQEPVALDLYGFVMEITQIGLGNEEDGRRWFGFSGDISLLEHLPVKESVDGLRLVWDPAGQQSTQIRLNGIGFAIDKPDTLSLIGEVKLIDAPDEKYFLGYAYLSLPKLGCGFDVGVKIGRDPAANYKYLYIYVGVNFPKGIPLFSSGTAIYGISGLYGMNIAPAIAGYGGDWYQWYLSPPRFDVAYPDKWQGEENALALGAGMVLGTNYDNGWTLSLKTLVALLLPGPVIIIHGKANILKQKSDVASAQEGLFNALAILDANAGTFTLNIDAAWSVEKLLQIQAGAEAYFNFNNPAEWHLYLGQESPAEKRIRLDVLALFNADGYLMIDGSGLMTGFGVIFGKEWKFGPVKVVLRAWIEAMAAISWRPLQLAGQIGLGGEFAISVALFQIGLSAEALLSGKTPRPYHVLGMLQVKVSLPIPLKDLDKQIKLEWQQTALPVIEDSFVGASLDHPKISQSWEPVFGLPAQTPLTHNFDPGPIVPLDGRPNLTFNRSVRDSTGLNNANIQYAGSSTVGDYNFDYDLISVRLEYWPKAGGHQWKAVEHDKLFGAWTAVHDAEGNPAGSTLQLWTKSPFEFARNANRVYRDEFLMIADWPCHPLEEAIVHCVDWEDVPENTVYPPIFSRGELHFIMEQTVEVGIYDRLVLARCGLLKQADLTKNGQNRIWIGFPEPAQWVELCFRGKINRLRTFGDGQLLSEESSFPSLGKFRLAATGIEWIELITGDGSSWPEKLFLASICYEFAETGQLREQALDFQERIEGNLIHWASERALLKPETCYRVIIETETTRRGPTGTTTDAFQHMAYFQTAGGPAIVLDEAADIPAETLNPAPYIQAHIPEVNQAAVYRAYDIGLEFNENYIEQLYGADLRLRLVDDNDQPLRNKQGVEILFNNRWGELPDSGLAFTEIDYVARVLACSQIETFETGANSRFSPAQDVLFSDQFDGSVTWRVENVDFEGQERAAGSPSESLLTAGNSAWTTIVISAALTAKSKVISMVFRFSRAEDGETHYYRLYADSEVIKLERKLVESETLWVSETGYQPGAWDHLLISCVGPRIRVVIDDRFLLLDIRDDFLPAGKIGIYEEWRPSFQEMVVYKGAGLTLAPNTRYNAQLLGSAVLFHDQLVNGWGDAAWGHFNRGAEKIALIGNPGWRDYQLEFSCETDAAKYGALVRWQQAGDSFSAIHLVVNPSAQRIEISQITGSINSAGAAFTIENQSLLWSCENDCSVDFGLDQVNLKLGCVGDLLTLTINSVPLVSVLLPANPSAGLCGLYIESDKSPRFSDVVVYSRPQQEIYRWPFTSSRYLNFVDHLDSFAGNVWSEGVFEQNADQIYQLLKETKGTIANSYGKLFQARMLLERCDALSFAQCRLDVQEAVEAYDASAVTQFNFLYSLVNRQTYRPLPPRLELTTIWLAKGKAIWLLESPEPLLWERIKFDTRQIKNDDTKLQVDSVAVWSQDKTRAFIFSFSNITFEPGLYEATFIFETDLGAESAILSYHGIRRSEVARLKFEIK